MHAVVLVGLLFSAALPAEPSPADDDPWRARLSVGVRAASLDTPKRLGLSFFSDALLELRLFNHVALQAGTWPLVLASTADQRFGRCGYPAPAALRVGVSEFGDWWELG